MYALNRIVCVGLTHCLSDKNVCAIFKTVKSSPLLKRCLMDLWEMIQDTSILVFVKTKKST